MIGGGDGTIGCAAGVLAALESPAPGPVLGVLPLGTANDFARTLDIPDQALAAVDVLADGKIVDVDLGWGNDQPFVNVASLGLSVGSARALKPGLKKALGPAVLSAVDRVAYARHRPFTLWMEFPDHDLDPLPLDDLLQVSIGNGRYYGGGHTIAPDAGIDDHKLDVYAVKAGRLRTTSAWRGCSRTAPHRSRRRPAPRHPEPAADDRHRAGGQPRRRDRPHTPVDFRLQRNAFEVVVPEHVTHVRHELGSATGQLGQLLDQRLVVHNCPASGTESAIRRSTSRRWPFSPIAPVPPPARPAARSEPHCPRPG